MILRHTVRSIFAFGDGIVTPAEGLAATGAGSRFEVIYPTWQKGRDISKAIRSKKLLLVTVPYDYPGGN